MNVTTPLQPAAAAAGGSVPGASKSTFVALGTLVKLVGTKLRKRLEDSCSSHLLDMRVFGSRARGDARPDSDLDLFVMVDTTDREIRTAIFDAAWDVGYELGLPFSIHPLVMTRQHFEELRKRERLIAREIDTDGITL